MGARGPGLAKLEAYIENLKRQLTLGNATLTDVNINTSQDMTISGATKLKGTTNFTGATTVTGHFKADEMKSNSKGDGFAGTGHLFKSSVEHFGDLVCTQIFVDITGMTADGGAVGLIIGKDGENKAHMGQVTTALNGTVVGWSVECIEVPNGNKDIDFYAATAETGAQGSAIGDLTETAIYIRGGNWAAGETKFTDAAPPAANSYMYMTTGADSAATYTQGQFLITMWGYV
jgi:hypothetical protein